MEELKKVKNIMFNNDLKIAVFKENIEVYTSVERGIKPMYELYTKFFKEAENTLVSDRVIGTAAARILSELKVKAVYTEIISEDAEKIFKANGIYFEYDKKVERILNRSKDDFCPIEKLSMEYDIFSKLFLEIEKFLINLNLVEVG